jgi:hypothetical protein
VSLQNKLREADLPDDKTLTVTYSVGGDVIHARDGYTEDVLSSTGFAETVAQVITTAGFNNEAIDNMRNGYEDYLEDYPRDGSGFESFVANVISENIYEFDFIDQTVEQYDYKRGFLTLEANVRATVGDIMSAPENLFTGWSTNVETKIGTLRIDG